MVGEIQVGKCRLPKFKDCDCWYCTGKREGLTEGKQLGSFNEQKDFIKQLKVFESMMRVEGIDDSNTFSAINSLRIIKENKVKQK
jgi:hypothetical protein